MACSTLSFFVFLASSVDAFVASSGFSERIASSSNNIHTDIPLRSSLDGEARNGDWPEENSEEDLDKLPIIGEAAVRVDDGGSDLTDRFKYKVNALMGVFDPQSETDDERQDGNILSAMLKFPVRYSFNVVGRTSGDDVTKEKYVEDVKGVVSTESGDVDGMECRVTPRGKNFTRVSILVTVESAAIINSIYSALGDIELTVMKY